MVEGMKSGERYITVASCLYIVFSESRSVARSGHCWFTKISSIVFTNPVFAHLCRMASVLLT